MERCDDRRCRNRSAGGAALPQPGKHLHDVSREVVLPLLDRLERANLGKSWNTWQVEEHEAFRPGNRP